MGSEGERWGNYLLEARIGAGGMAEVFRARRVGAASFSRLVCVKRLHPYLSEDAQFIALFLDEARTGARLRHRNIIAIEDLGIHEGRYFLAMEFINGVDLAQLEERALAAGVPVPAEVGVFLAAELLGALDAAHTARDPDDGSALHVVHRDVSPHNVLVSYGGEVKLSDFGIARAERRLHRTQGAVVRGRFGYMPLEQASARELDARADLFALGVTLFELLAGRRPFRGDDPDATLESIIVAQATDDRPALASLRPDLPPALVALIEQLLRPAPEDRPASAAAALATLHGLPERVTGGAALVALMATLYPSHASAVYLPRLSTPPSILPSAPAPAITPPETGPPGEPIDPYAPTGVRAPLALVLEESVPAAPAIALPAPAASPRTKRARPWITVLLLALAVGGGATVLSRARTAPSTTPASAQRPPAARDIPSTAITLSPSVTTADLAPAPPEAPPPAPAPAPLPAPAPAPAPVHRPSVRERASVPREAAPSPAVARATAPAPSPPSAPEAPALGTLVVIALPWGEVSIDNQPRGRSPVTVRVPVGEHTVRITGGVEETRRVTVTANGVARVLVGE